MRNTRKNRGSREPQTDLMIIVIMLIGIASIVGLIVGTGVLAMSHALGVHVLDFALPVAGILALPLLAWIFPPYPSSEKERRASRFWDEKNEK